MSGSPLQHGVRRVVTGVDSLGKAVIVADERIEGDLRALPLWSADVAPAMGDPVPPPAQGWWPPPGGVRVTLSSRRPDGGGSDARPVDAAWPDINDAAGFHASCSTDIVFLMSGTIWLELDDGVEVRLDAGDVLVQNGTRHRWHNHGDDWPVIAVVIVGALPPQSG